MKTKEERAVKLGFIPQKENIYNNALPYADKLDAESEILLNEIKINICKAILSQNLGDISFWSENLSRYIRLYGRKFSKEDHIYFIKILYELMIMPDVELEFVKKVATILYSLVKKTNLLSREDLELPWRPLLDLLERIFNTSYETYGMIIIPCNLESLLKNLVRACSPYFPVESTKEILEEFRPLMCPFDCVMARAINYFECFLCTSLPPSQHDQGFKLWFNEFMEIWENWHNIPSWENALVHLFSRVAKDNIGFIDWEPYIPKVFTRLLRSFNLPGRTSMIQVVRAVSTFDTVAVATLLASMLGKGSSCQLYISRMFKSLESFYHPSNHGRWLIKMQRLLQKLPHAVIKRLHRERYSKNSWRTPVPDEFKLSDADITDFVKSVVPSVLLSMFSKRGCQDSVIAFQNLGVLRPELVIPPILERLTSSLETLTEPHRLVATMHCTIPVCRPLVQKNKYFPEGPRHVIPLLMASLPGIDPNDIRKCMITCQFISILSTLVLIVDCSGATNSQHDLPEVAQEVCAETRLFEDFVLQFMDRIFVLIENSCLENPSRLDRDSERTNPEENFLEMAISSTFGIIMMQSSPAIFEVALRKLQTFIQSHIFEIKVSGKFAAHMCRLACRVNPERSLQVFLPHFSKLVFALTESDDIMKEEKLDDELLFSLLILAEIVRCEGNHVLKYHDLIVKVLKKSLSLTCKEGYQLGCYLLRQTLKSYVTLYPLETCSVPNPWNRHDRENAHKYLEDWGVSGNIQNLDMKFHNPSVEESAAAKSLLEMFLVPELEKLQNWTLKNITITREEVHRSLSIVSDCLLGASVALPMWEEEPLQMRDTSMPVHVPVPLQCGAIVIDVLGRNVRKFICDVTRQVLAHITECCEDDTKGLFKIIQLLNVLMFHWGIEKDEYSNKMKAFGVVKNILENKLYGEKKHIRSLLLDRVHMQHDSRTTERYRYYFTETHISILRDVLKISTSHYSEVRKRAQTVLQNCFTCFYSSYTVVFPEILELLKKDPTLFHEEFKGVLHIIIGNKNKNLIRIRNWELISQLWPAIVSSKHSEKPSIIKLLDSISAYLQKNFPTFQISLTITKSCMKLANDFLINCNPSSTFSDEQILNFSKDLADNNTKRKRSYHELVQNLVILIQSGNLHWRHYHLGLNMLTVLVRCDILLPKEGVNIFVTHLIYDTLAVRKLALQGVLCVMKQQKRKHPKIKIDPFAQNSKNLVLHPLIPTVSQELVPDNFWLQYNSMDPPDTEEKWNSRHFVHKTHWGFYSFPKNFEVHAFDSEQPNLDRSLKELSDVEKPIFEAFSQEQFIDTLVSYFSLEEKKDHDKFDIKKFYLFQSLFNQFGDTFLPQFLVHLRRMVVDKQESVQRCASEIVSGILNGCKHWDFKKMHNLKEEISPILESVISNLTPETLKDWAACISSISESHDPNKYYWVLELFMKEPQSIENGSFLEASWLYLLTQLISQQEWRACELLHRSLAYILPKLDHSYQNVREKLGSFLVYIFMYDIPVNAKTLAYTPKLVPFLSSLLPKFDILTSSMDDDEINAASSEDSPERKSAKNLFLTICRWISLNGSKTLLTAPSSVFQLLPLLCHMVHDSTDEGFQRECRVTIAILAQALLGPDSINAALTTLQNIASNRSWHSRVAGAAFLQQMVFSNLFTIMHNEAWTRVIYDIVIQLLQDDRVEVRESASETLCGFFHCEYFKIDDELLSSFKSKCQKKLKNKRTAGNGPKTFETDELRDRHAGILGLCSCVNAYPYDVPEFLPDILVLLGDHLNDPQPIAGTIKKTLSSFRRTHHDNWRDHKLKFTDDQLAVITDLLISPCYYA